MNPRPHLTSGQPGRPGPLGTVLAGLAGFAGFTGFAGFAGFAAGAQEELPGVFSEIVEVRVVNLEAVVTDGEGVRVRGLGPEDFELRVDGEEIPIAYFTEILGGQAVEREGAAAQAPEGIPAVAPGADVGTSYLLFIDDFFSVAKDRDRVLDLFEEDLPVVGAGDRLAVVAYDGRHLEMLTSWTRSPSQLEDAFDRARRRPAYGLRRVAERRSLLYLQDTANLGGNRRFQRAVEEGRLDIEEEELAEQLSEQVERVVAAATATLRSFAAPPGRKVMLLLSGGWPFSPARYTVADPQRIVLDRKLLGGPQLFDQLADTANRLGFTLYPVDLPGLLSADGVAEEQDPGLGQAAGLGFRGEAFREHETHAALQFLAERTGGRALLDGQRGDCLARAYEDTRSYYWLGFVPTWRGDDGVHDVELRVRRKGFDVRTRKGYQDLSRRSEVGMMVESALLFGNAPSAEPLEVALGKPRRAGRGKVEVEVRVSIPLEAVTLLPVEGATAARVELRLAAVDEDGGRSEIPVIPVELRGPRNAEPAGTVEYRTTLLLRRKTQDLVVALYDPASGTLLSANRTLRF